MSQNLQNFANFQKIQRANLVDFEKCCKTHIYLQTSVPIQPKTSNICRNFAKNWQLPYGSPPRTSGSEPPVGRRIGLVHPWPGRSHGRNEQRRTAKSHLREQTMVSDRGLGSAKLANFAKIIKVLAGSNVECRMSKMVRKTP